MPQPYHFLFQDPGPAGESIQAAVEEFDPAVGAWEQRASLPGPRRDPCAVVINCRIYIVGGFYKDAAQPLPILAYDTAHDRWQTKKTLSRASSCWGAHAINGRIFILGSQEENPDSSVLEVYDPAKDRIVQKTPIPGLRKAYTTAVLNGRIYAIGGQLQRLEDPVGSVDVYDPAKDKWTKVTDLPKPKSWAGAVGIGTMIYVLGGVHTDWFHPEDAVDVLDVR